MSHLLFVLKLELAAQPVSHSPGTGHCLHTALGSNSGPGLGTWVTSPERGGPVGALKPHFAGITMLN